MGSKTSKVKKAVPHPLMPKLQGSSLTLKFSKEGAAFYELTPFGSQFLSSAHHPSKAAGGTGTPSNNDVEGDKRKEYQGCDWLHEVSITIRKVKPTSAP